MRRVIIGLCLGWFAGRHTTTTSRPSPVNGPYPSPSADQTAIALLTASHHGDYQSVMGILSGLTHADTVCVIAFLAGTLEALVTDVTERRGGTVDQWLQDVAGRLAAREVS